MKHHELAVDMAVRRYSRAEGACAVVLIGSVARGDERPDSDVDLYLVVTENSYPDYVSSGRLAFVDGASDIYDGAYFDVKVITVDQLRLAAQAADDPMRASFQGARRLWAVEESVGTDVDELVAAIVTPVEERWTRHEAAFIAQARLHAFYFLDQGEKLDNQLLRSHAAVHFAFSVGRALLARGRVLFAGPKYLEKQLEALAGSPPDIVARLRAVVTTPTARAALDLLVDVETGYSWPLAAEQTTARFIEDNELAWLTGVTPPEYR
jgi:hypothetical protein